MRFYLVLAACIMLTSCIPAGGSTQSTSIATVTLESPSSIPTSTPKPTKTVVPSAPPPSPTAIFTLVPTETSVPTPTAVPVPSADDYELRVISAENFSTLMHEMFDIYKLRRRENFVASFNIVNDANDVLRFLSREVRLIDADALAMSAADDVANLAREPNLPLVIDSVNYYYQIGVVAYLNRHSGSLSERLATLDARTAFDTIEVDTDDEPEYLVQVDFGWPKPRGLILTELDEDGIYQLIPNKLGPIHDEAIEFINAFDLTGDGRFELIFQYENQGELGAYEHEIYGWRGDQFDLLELFAKPDIGVVPVLLEFQPASEKQTGLIQLIRPEQFVSSGCFVDVIHNYEWDNAELIFRPKTAEFRPNARRESTCENVDLSQAQQHESDFFQRIGYAGEKLSPPPSCRTNKTGNNAPWSENLIVNDCLVTIGSAFWRIRNTIDVTRDYRLARDMIASMEQQLADIALDNTTVIDVEAIERARATLSFWKGYSYEAEGNTEQAIHIYYGLVQESPSSISAKLAASRIGLKDE